MATQMKAAIHHLGSVHRRGAGSAALGELAFRITALLSAYRRSGESSEGSDDQN
ncbi:hypothetical protein [Agrobacterium sp. DE0009]|uniref:hypothetical protein n=1 Tax=Agrobacterium sp. DE0009 TaxID=2587505 RepID=UPI00164399D2|nr:hypothetical protein [Agrobacterium sp. DE0009]